MKKIISLVVFTIALVWTWNIIHSTPAIGFETHSGVQQKLAELIQATIQNKKPEAQNFQVTRLWTESLNDNKIRAVFAYKFVEPASEGEVTEQFIEGEAVLYRDPTGDSETDQWVLQSVKTTNDSIIFSEGSLISPNSEDSAAPTTESVETETPAAAPATEKAPEK